MNDQLQAELLKIVTKINNGSDTAWGFITEQTPDVISQLLTWYCIQSFLEMFISSSLFAVAAYFLVKFSKKAKSESYGVDGADIIYALSAVAFVSMIPIALVLFNITWLQIIVAPKVWLLEYIAAAVS